MLAMTESGVSNGDVETLGRVVVTEDKRLQEAELEKEKLREMLEASHPAYTTKSSSPLRIHTCRNRSGGRGVLSESLGEQMG